MTMLVDAGLDTVIDREMLDWIRPESEAYLLISTLHKMFDEAHHNWFYPTKLYCDFWEYESLNHNFRTLIIHLEGKMLVY